MGKATKAVEDWSDTPDWPTMIRSKLSDGRLLGVDNSLWLYRAVPLAPVAEARSPEEGVQTAIPVMMAIDELAAMTSTRLDRRSSSRAAYRQIHMLLVNLPQRFVPPADHPIADYLATSMPNTSTDRRVLLFGVRLISKVGGAGGLRAAIDSVAETLAMGVTPLSDYDPDYKDVSGALARAGLTTPSHADLRLASAWWNEGNAPDTPMLSQVDCLHVFTTAEAARSAKRAGPDAHLAKLGAGHHTITFASVSDLDLPFVAPTDPRAHWATQLVDQGALAISVRGKVEPTTVTRSELRRQRKRYIDDINERVKAGKMERTEQTEQEDLLAGVEAVYATGGPPTVIETSIVVGFNGHVTDMADLSRDLTAKLLPMWYRQRSAMAETMLCSAARANPHLQDLPAQSVAVSGLPSLSTVGDKTGALLGFTESDRQPAWMDPMAAADQDSLPLALCAGQTGAGKSGELSTRVPTPVSVRFPDGWTTIGELVVGDTIFGRDGLPCQVTALSAVEALPDLYRLTFSDGQTINADSNHQWVVSSFEARNGVRHPHRLIAQDAHVKALATADALDELSLEFGPDAEATLRELHALVLDRVPATAWREPAGVDAALRMVDAPYTVRVTDGPVPVTNLSHQPVAYYPTAVALKSLATRVRQQHADAPVLEAGEVVMSTGELLDAGVHMAGKQARFAVRVAGSLELPDADLAVPPYLLGAWLGDGTTRAGTMTCDPGHPDEHGHSDQHYVVEAFAAHYPRTHAYTTGRLQAVGIPGLSRDLHRAGVLGNKHIPAVYLRASTAQRLAVLQGLMDTDGTINPRGGCELALCHERLSTDSLELIRSLGIKATMTSGPAAITEADPDHPGHTRRRVTSTQYRITFTTNMPVFRLPRKTARLPVELRETAGWNYITSIEPIPPVPARCLTVNSVDSTYLVEGFIPTHNTVGMLWLADQWARMGTPVIIVDPKAESDHSAAVRASGGQVASLDELASADGIFDPIRFSAKKDVGVELAASMLMSINPWGTKREDYETPLQYALHYGVSRGAECVGQALRIAKDEGHAPPEMVDAADRLAQSSSMFRAMFGINPASDGLRVADGITLIKVGSAHLDLPAPGQATVASLPQRIALALVRMMVFGSAMALTGRDGVVMLDEAWVFLSAGREEMERLGRLARSQRVFPMMFTQRVSDAVNAGLTGYISRGLIGPIQDRDEAIAACTLFKLAPTEERIARITAPEFISSGASTALNWSSMRALIDPANRQVHRGSVWIYCDVSGRAVPVEVLIPPAFLARASTNAAEMRQRVNPPVVTTQPVAGTAQVPYPVPQTAAPYPVPPTNFPPGQTP